jgi:hypothetical protein
LTARRVHRFRFVCFNGGTHFCKIGTQNIRE